MRLLQISDPHLVADPRGLCRGRQPLQQLRRGLELALSGDHGPIDQLLLSGDLCHDESWQGYCRLRDLLQAWDLPAAFAPGNHDHPQRLRAALARHGSIAPARLSCGSGDLLLLDSHLAASDAGQLGARQLAWLAAQLLQRDGRALLVALHHPPVAIGDPLLDTMALRDGPELLALLRPVAELKAVLFGHIHQHWQGDLPGRAAGLLPVPLLGCPSSLCSFAAVQPCPLGRAEQLGMRLLTIDGAGRFSHALLRWHPDGASSLDAQRLPLS